MTNREVLLSFHHTICLIRELLETPCLILDEIKTIKYFLEIEATPQFIKNNAINQKTNNH